MSTNTQTQTDDGEAQNTDAETAEAEAEAKWWDNDAITPGDSWKDSDRSHLENLINVPGLNADAGDPVPWVGKGELQLRGVGGIESRERRAYTLVGRGGVYGSHVEGNRTLNTVYRESKVGGPRTETIEHTDELNVLGNASYRFKARGIMMTGNIEKTWNGGVMKAASMEGVICGGVMVRTIGGAAMTLGGMATGDVYIGVARAAGMRLYIAQLLYRSTSGAAAWAIGLWVRNTTFTIVPVTMAPAPGQKPAGNAAQKMSRLNRTARKVAKGLKAAATVGRMVCPVIDILLGLLSILLIPFGIRAMVKAYKQAKVQPLVAAPRLETRNAALTLETYGSKKVT